MGSVLVACLGLIGLVTGCGASEGLKPKPDRTELRAFPCDPSASPDEEAAAAYQREARYNGRSFAPAIDTDYFAVRRVGLSFPEAERGVVCSGAGDRAACQQRFDALVRDAAPSDSMLRRIYKTPYVITTHGDDVRLWSPSAFGEVLGAIETPLEAWLLMRASRDMPVVFCGDAQVSAYRSVADGYELRFRQTTKGCRPYEQTETLLHVGTAGTRLLYERVAIRDPERCVVD
jgi:hypothetical protein